MFSGVSLPVPLYGFSGFGQTSEDIQSWIDATLKPIADIVKKYYDLQAQQGLQAPVVKSSAIPSLAGISPWYFVGGGILLWYLLKGNGVKGRSRR